MSTKRKVFGDAIGRRVRARREESEDIDLVDSDSESIQSLGKAPVGDSASEDEEDESVCFGRCTINTELTHFTVRIGRYRGPRCSSNSLIWRPRKGTSNPL
jgi:hypothetical protein